MKQVQTIDKIWKCPVCGKRHGLEIAKENKGFLNKINYIKCSGCATEFEIIAKNGKIEKIKLRKEGVKHSPFFNLEEEYEIEKLRNAFLANLALETIEVPTAFILAKEEKVFFYENVTRKDFVSKTEMVYVKNKKPTGLLAVVFGRNNGGQGQNYQPAQEVKEVFEKVDSGAFMITNKRIAFAGRKNTFSILLGDILSIGFDEEANIYIGTTKGQLFLDTEKPVKNEIIDIVKFLRKEE